MTSLNITFGCVIWFIHVLRTVWQCPNYNKRSVCVTKVKCTEALWKVNELFSLVRSWAGEKYHILCAGKLCKLKLIINSLSPISQYLVVVQLRYVYWKWVPDLVLNVGKTRFGYHSEIFYFNIFFSHEHRT